MSNAQGNWLNSMTWQADFYHRAGPTRRKDPEFEWHTYERMQQGTVSLRRLVKSLLRTAGLRQSRSLSPEWMYENASLLWNTREILADDLSRLLFDSSLIARMTDHRHFYFPRIDFDDLLDFTKSGPFTAVGFPHEYIGMPLDVFDVRLHDRIDSPRLKIITRQIQLQLVNSYRQYLIRRNGYDVSPKVGDVVYDCGACIGEISLLFATLVAPSGEVHLFDPMPLHTRFCELQAAMNPALAPMLHINTCAVGGRTHDARRSHAESDEITPGARVNTDDFACTTLDDYAATKGGRVDFIKMDIEGAEMEALRGAAGVIKEFKPRLAISGYHKPQDLWEIPRFLKELNPGYQITFGHHTPIIWESVFYAVNGASPTAAA
jgi:FkbM family methyltransferase